MKLIQIFRSHIKKIDDILRRIDYLQESIGRIEARQCRQDHEKSIHKNEFRVYSQNGEDGIIQFLIENINISRKIFIEFGVENYLESNTRFLLKKNNWSGLILDGSSSNIEYIKSDPIYWRHNLKAQCVFVNRDNINEIIKKNGLFGEIGLLSIDVDGNDYWIWQAIDSVSPQIFICEYNSLFGQTRKVTIPYSENFIRSKSHFSNLYYGSSIAALTDLSQSKGYQLVGSNSIGNNLFFVRNDVIGNLPTYSPDEAYIQAQFRESRDTKGQLNYLTFNERLMQIAEMPLIDLETNTVIQVKDLI